MPRNLKIGLLSSFLIGCLFAHAQEKGAWRAASTTARSITGDVVLSDEKIILNAFSSFTMVRVRTLEPAETSAVFGLDNNGPGSLYRLEIPAARRFLNKNSLCGTDDIHWMTAFASGRSLQLAFFSSQKPPIFTLEAINNSTDLCGTFSYSK